MTSNWRCVALAGVALAALALSPTVGFAQSNSAEPSLLDMATGPAAPETRMLVEADSLVYDIDDEQISAIGKVTIYYGPYTLMADQVVVNRRTERVVATGSVELTDADGNVVRGASIDLTDDLRDGVAEALEIVTAQRTAFTARQAQREAGDVTTFEDGVYLPCVDCNGDRGRKPIWQIRANRIIHRQGERTITFEKARFEFMGVPLAYVPVLTQPDPSVRRKSGFLIPRPTYSEELGAGLRVPYFYALAPNMDVTVTPGLYSRQGPLADVEFRHRVIDGSYSIRVAGLRQSDPEAFGLESGNRTWRGSFASEGDFRINNRWNWGWDLAVATDRSFFDDYDLPGDNGDSFTNDIFIKGIDGRNRFEAHAYGFFIQQEDSTVAGAPPQDVSLQSKQPIVHPSIDHQIYAPEGIAGGEASLTTNFTSLTRQTTDIFEFENGAGTRLRGPSGTFTRGSIDALWRRRFVDSVGQVFTPFAYFRGDVFFSSPQDDSGLPATDTEFAGRAMPAVGLEYSFPIQILAGNSSHVIEPVAQLILRPNETETGDIANDDSQSLVFDANSLFDYDKFSGFDRVEGGSRANVGLRYSGQFAGGMALTGTAGRSIHLAGQNSFATDTAYDTGEDSGLETDASDYVAALSLNTNRGLILGGAARFDEADFGVNRFEGQVVGLAGPLTGSITYAFIREQVDLGIDDRSEVQIAANLRLNENWRLFGASQYDIENDDFVRNAIGFGYDLEEFSMSLAYAEDRTSSSDPVDRTIFLRLGLRTIGDTGASFDFDN